MIISRIKLDIDNPETQRGIESPSRIHGAVEHAFHKEERQHALWRIDFLGGEYYLLIVSHDMPDLDHVQEQFGEKGGTPEIKNYDKFLDAIENGQVWKFRLAANPTKSRSGRRYQLSGIESKMDWLMRKSRISGFLLEEGKFSITGEKQHDFKKWEKLDGGRTFAYPVDFGETDFEGVLTVTDADLFKRVLCHGIGHERAYGTGLLTISK